jgi:shikimate dehydrogenase
MSVSGIDRYGVMGFPVSHSRSPIIHRLFAVQTGQDLQYELLQVTPDKLVSSVRQFQDTGGKGLNITLPHKTDVMQLVDDMSDRAKSAGAINTLSFDDNGIHGDNTDGVGLMRDLTTNLGLRLLGSNILVLGAGGATRGILGPLLEARPNGITVANRTLSRASDLVEHFSGVGPVSACQFDDVATSVSYDLVINATSAGVKGEVPPYPDTAVGPQTCCYDLSYGLGATPFSQWAAAQGAARSITGWGMLVEQAAESFLIWRGVRPNTSTVLKQMSVNAS